MNRHVFLLLVVSTLLGGCTRTPKYECRVTTYLSPDLGFPAPQEERSIAVVTETSPGQPLLEREVSRKIEHLLLGRGYDVKPLGQADHVLFAFFAIDSGSTVSGSYNAYVPGGTAYTRVRSSTGQWATATTHLPGGTQQRSYSYTYFMRHLEMTLYDHARFVTESEKREDARIIWTSSTTSAGSSSDLRSVIDYLLVATFEEFGRDTGQQLRRSLREDDDRVKELRASTAQGSAGSQND